MIPIPESITVKRSAASEKLLNDKARAWIEAGDRTPGLHASDMLDPLMGYMNTKHPKPLSDKMVNMFLIGKVLHAFVLGAVDDRTGLDITETDDGSKVSSELGISFSPDAVINGKVRELKTSRAMYEPKDVAGIDTYIEQLLVYMAATNTTESELWILFLSLKNPETKRTDPSFRAYTISVSEADLEATKVFIRTQASALSKALEAGDPSGLPLCRAFKCGAKNCPHWNDCKPKGRYGDPKWG